MPIKGVDPANVPERYRAIFTNNPFADHLDLEVVSVDEGRSVLRFPFRRELTQYQGAVQGGIVVAYADAAMAVAAASIAAPGTDFVTTDMSVQFVRPLTSGYAIARAVVEHAGKTLIRMRASVENDSGASVAFLTSTFMIVAPRAPERR